MHVSGSGLNKAFILSFIIPFQVVAIFYLEYNDIKDEGLPLSLISSLITGYT